MIRLLGLSYSSSTLCPHKTLFSVLRLLALGFSCHHPHPGTLNPLGFAGQGCRAFRAFFIPVEVFIASELPDLFL